MCMLLEDQGIMRGPFLGTNSAEEALPNLWSFVDEETMFAKKSTMAARAGVKIVDMDKIV